MAPAVAVPVVVAQPMPVAVPTGVPATAYLPPTPASQGAPFLEFTLAQGLNDRSDGAQGAGWIRSNGRSAWMHVVVDCASVEQATELVAAANGKGAVEDGVVLTTQLLYADGSVPNAEKGQRGKHCDKVELMTKHGSTKSESTIPITGIPQLSVRSIHPHQSAARADCPC